MFKESFKYYKSKNPPPDFDKVLDLDNNEKIAGKIHKKELTDNENCSPGLGLKPTKKWVAYELLEHPGLIFIKNPFTSIGQRYWTVRALQDFSKKPNKTNLDALNLVPEDKEWWDICQNNNNKLLVDKLRWVTLGYHHNWDTKVETIEERTGNDSDPFQVYTEDSKGDFPKDLADLSHDVTRAFGFANFKAEAAIVNYYHMDSTLSGHTDYSEPNLEAPLISFSFGQTAIFLLGGPSKEDEPSAILLRSGDIVIMSQQSRLCYHGVPKILQMDSRFWDNFEHNDLSNKEHKEVVTICKEEALWKPFGDYLNHSRINLNVRQVLKRGQKRLCSESDEKT